MLILVNKVPTEGQPFEMAINERNILEVTPKGNGSWMRYWDGGQVRSAIIQETPEEVCNYAIT